MVYSLLEDLDDAAVNGLKPSGHYYYYHFDILRIDGVVSLHETARQSYSLYVPCERVGDCWALFPIVAKREVGARTLR